MALLVAAAASAAFGAYIGYRDVGGIGGAVIAAVVAVLWIPWTLLIGATVAVWMFRRMGVPVSPRARAWSRAWFWRAVVWQVAVGLPLVVFASWGNSAQR